MNINTWPSFIPYIGPVDGILNSDGSPATDRYGDVLLGEQPIRKKGQGRGRLFVFRWFSATLVVATWWEDLL